MRVFVIGGTGAVGQHAVRALIDLGHTVTALARNDGKADQVRSDGAVPVDASIFDPESLDEAFDGHDAVVNLASAIPPVTKFMSKSSVDGQRSGADRRIDSDRGRRHPRRDRPAGPGIGGDDLPRPW